jgi:hypothetical protein
MDNREAIEQIDILKKFIGYDKDSIMVKRIFEALDLAISALEKQVAKKKTDREWYTDVGCCPTCKAEPHYTDDLYCANCGQRLEVSP